MPSVQELYELWAEDSELRETLRGSLDPRGPEWLLDLFRSLEPRAGELLVDVGCRDARHTIRLATEHGLRVVALDPVPLHVDVRRGLGECARVLRAGGRMIAYVTLATELLEPRERADLVAAAAVASES